MAQAQSSIISLGEKGEWGGKHSYPRPARQASSQLQPGQRSPLLNDWKSIRPGVRLCDLYAFVQLRVCFSFKKKSF